MTEDFKKELLKQLVGKTEITTPNDKPEIAETGNVNIDFANYITLTNNDYMEVIDVICPNDSTGNINVVYGNYGKNDYTTWYGFICLVDDKYNVLELWTSNSEGTTLRPFARIKQATDGTFYAVDSNGYDDGNQIQRRLVLMNNFTVKDDEGNFILNYRKTYIIVTNDFYIRDVFKNDDTADYVFLGNYISTVCLGAIKLKIEVGASNTWEQYTSSYSAVLDGWYAYFDSDSNVYVEYIEMDTDTDNSTTEIIKYEKALTSTTWTKTSLITLNSGYINATISGQGITFVNSSTFYYIVFPYPYNTYKYIIFKWDGTNNTEIASFDKNDTDTAYSGNVKYVNGVLYFSYTTNVDSNYYGIHNVGIYDGTNVYTYNVSSTFGYQQFLYVDNKFNKLVITTISNKDYLDRFVFNYFMFDYNKANYNGREYTDGETTLVPLKTRLYDSNGSLDFARNLYNISINGNQTTSTVEIPNNFLNDNSIAQSDLISETNFQMNSYDVSWEKNIYEKVYLNFINTISMTDEDNTNSKFNPGKFNNDISTGTNGSITSIVLYDDTNQQIIQTISSYSVNKLNDFNYQIKFPFTAEATGDFFFVFRSSGDIAFIPVSVVSGNNYLFSQKIRIGNKVVANNLMYNGEQVLYNNEEVNAYVE